MALYICSREHVLAEVFLSGQRILSNDWQGWICILLGGLLTFGYTNRFRNTIKRHIIHDSCTELFNFYVRLRRTIGFFIVCLYTHNERKKIFFLFYIFKYSVYALWHYISFNERLSYRFFFFSIWRYLYWANRLPKFGDTFYKFSLMEFDVCLCAGDILMKRFLLITKYYMLSPMRILLLLVTISRG